MLTDEQVEDLYATHPVVRVGNQDLLNNRYVDPVQFAAAHRDAPPDPVEQTVPTVELINPSPSTARATVGRLTQQSELSVSEVEGLILATKPWPMPSCTANHPSCSGSGHKQTG
jgi:hypothetical protein